MGGSSRVGTAGDARDLVFISYSHDDVAWVQRFKVLLSPLLRAKRLRLWVDTDIRTGDTWHPDILDAIRRSATALVLVSADFLDSHFIMDEELPALIRHGVRLAPVLVGSCLWNYVPELAGVQWLHDPGRDGPLNLVEKQPAERDRRLLKICNRLIEVAPIAAPERVTHIPAVPTGPVAALRAGSVLGDLDKVPELPPGYIARDELRTLVDLVVSTDNGAVGLTGQVQTVGLHGQGGIGKSVLAAALARDESIRGRFPDGVHWVTVGEKPDLLAAQLDLLARLGDGGTALRTCDEATQRLTTLLRERRVLLVVDDVWSDVAALAFRVTGALGRVLYTTRDAGILAASGATPHQVRVLSPAETRALSARILDIPPDSLPAAADQAFDDVGRVALAVALVAAAVRGGQSWDEVADALVQHGRTYGDHPYANTFKAMQIAVAALAPELADALLTLAVFPPDTRIPTAAIARYWSRTRGADLTQTRRDLNTLTAANLLRYEQDSVGFHDLQYDYLLLHAPALTPLHTEILNAYRAALPADADDQWWRLPVGEPYIWDWLVAHLRAAGNRAELSRTVTNPAYHAHRIAASGTHAAEADLSQAADALPDDAPIAWWSHWMARHADLLAGALGQDGADSGSTARLAPTMLAWLTADRTLPETIDPQQLSRLLPAPFLTPRWGLTSPPEALVRVLTGHTGGVNAVAWSPDGMRLASASVDGQVRVWDPSTGRILTMLAGHAGGVNAVAWSLDGMRLASAGDDRQVRIWDPSTGRTLTVLAGHTGGVRAVAWSPNGTRLASASDDRQVRIWDPSTGRALTSLAGHTGWVRAVAWSPDGKRLASASVDSQVRIWDSSTGRTLTLLAGHTGWVNAVAWSPDGTQLASTGADSQVRIWDSSTGRILTMLAGHTGGVRAVAWSPDGMRLASVSDDRQVRIWDSSTGRTLTSLAGHTDWVNAVAWSPDGTQLASVSDDRQVRIWDSSTGGILTSLAGHTGGVRAVAWSPDGMRLASAGDDRQVRIWDSSTGRTLTSLAGHAGRVNAVAWSPDGTQLASVSDDRQVRIWDSSTGRILTSLAGHTGGVRAVAWSPDGMRLASAGDDRQVRIWDSSTGRARTSLAGHAGRVNAVAWSPDGTRLASASADSQVRIWDSSTGRALTSLAGHTGGVRAVAWSPDGTRLASASADRQVRIWDSSTGRALTSLAGHTDWVNAVAWSPDGTRLASAGNDGTVLVHHLQGDHTTRLRLLPLTCLAWSTTGIAVGGALSSVVVLELRM